MNAGLIAGPLTVCRSIEASVAGGGGGGWEVAEGEYRLFDFLGPIFVTRKLGEWAEED